MARLCCGAGCCAVGLAAGSNTHPLNLLDLNLLPSLFAAASSLLPWPALWGGGLSLASAQSHLPKGSF